MSLANLLEKYCDQEEFYHFEGESGLDNFTNICQVLGYTDDGMKYGSPIERFLGDNPGALEALNNWIGEQQLAEWEEAISSKLTELPDEDEDLAESEEKLTVMECRLD